MKHKPTATLAGLLTVLSVLAAIACGGEPRPPAPVAERELLERDWRMQDGVGTPRKPSTRAAAIARTLGRGDRLVAHLEAGGVALAELAGQWRRLRQEWRRLSDQPAALCFLGIPLQAGAPLCRRKPQPDPARPQRPLREH